MADIEPRNGGSLSAANRFARVESTLERIENKLDNKAEMMLVEQLMIRVGQIEHSALTAAAVLVATKEATATAVLAASSLAQDRMEYAQKIADKRYRFMLWVVGLFTAFSMAYNILRSVLALP